MNLFDTHFLFASLIWGSLGVGYFIYGKKQQALAPLVGGVLLIAVSYFAPTALVMSLLSVGVIIGVYVLTRLGY